MTLWKKVIAGVILSPVATTALSLSAASLYSESEMLAAPAIVTSISGSVKHTTPDGTSSPLKPHDIIFPHASSIEAEKGEHIFLVFSNGISLGVSSNSEIDVEHYKQTPFPSDKEGQHFEPSVSELSIQLRRGTIAVTSTHLSPLSKFTIKSPIGELRINSTSALIHYDESGLRVAAYSGSLTFYYPENKGREFIAETTNMLISTESMTLGRYAESVTTYEAPEAWRIFTQATVNAGKRAFFRSQGTHQTPQPVLIVPSEYFEQPESRPYEFIE